MATAIFVIVFKFGILSIVHRTYFVYHFESATSAMSTAMSASATAKQSRNEHNNE
jgi:hypothetical protein